MSAICGANRNDYVYWRRKDKKTGITHYMLMVDQMWYDPMLIIQHERGETLPQFKKRCEKCCGFKPLSKTEHWKHHIQQIKEHQKFTQSYEHR